VVFVVFVEIPLENEDISFIYVPCFIYVFHRQRSYGI